MASHARTPKENELMQTARRLIKEDLYPQANRRYAGSMLGKAMHELRINGESCRYLYRRFTGELLKWIERYLETRKHAA
jgi:hypothetical protein